MSAGLKLIARWRSQGFRVRPGCPSAVLDAFEAGVGAKIPADLREFLALANGVEMDGEGFSFWPLEAYESVEKAVIRCGPGLPVVSSPGHYYVFCDYLHWSWAYAIHFDLPHRTGMGNPVVPVGMTEIFVAAGSFSEFAELVLADSPRLYPR